MPCSPQISMYGYAKTMLDDLNFMLFTFSFFKRVQNLKRLEIVYLEECEANHRSNMSTR